MKSQFFYSDGKVSSGEKNKRIVTSNFAKGKGDVYVNQNCKKETKKKLILEGLTNFGEQSNNYLSIY